MAARVFCLPLFGAILLGSPVWADDSPDFARDVAPVLTTYCAGCHGAEAAENDVRLDGHARLAEDVLDRPLVVPGEPEQSLLVRLMRGSDEPRMPPEGEPQPEEQAIAAVEAWIAAGAPAPAASAATMRPDVPRLPPVEGSQERIHAVDRSPEGQLLALARFGTVELVDAGSGDPIRVLEGAAGKVNAVRFSRDGRFLVGASGVSGVSGQVIVWDVESGRQRATAEIGSDVLYAAELSPDGGTLAVAGYDSLVRMLSFPEMEVLRELGGHNGPVYDLAFDPAGEVLATASADETVKLWRAETGERLDTLGQPEAEQYRVVFSPDGRRVVAAGADHKIRVWRLMSTDAPTINPIDVSRFAHQRPVVALALSADGALAVSAAEDGSVKMWSTDRYRLLHQFPAAPDVPTGLAILPDARAAVVATLDGELLRHEIPPLGDEQAEVAGGGPRPRSVDAAPAAEPEGFAESEPNDVAKTANAVPFPVEVQGIVESDSGGMGGADCFRVALREGQPVELEVDAARGGSPLDAFVEVLDADGEPIERVVLQAVRESYFTFRGKDSNTSGDFRLHNWEEMELDEYLYSSGEVVRLWLYPRGPDSGFLVYPGEGQRHTFFGTTPVTHALGEPAYIVRPLPPGSDPLPNGLPVFSVYHENDDDPLRKWGKDSRLSFVAPRDGDYVVRIRDAGRMGGDAYGYKLRIRPARPHFTARVADHDLKIRPGEGGEFKVAADRFEGFEGPVEVRLENLPAGFSAHPVTIEPGQSFAYGTIIAAPDATAPPEDAPPTVAEATATIDGETVTQSIGEIGRVELDESEGPLVRLVPRGATPLMVAGAGPLRMRVRPGETVSARVVVQRGGFAGRISFGNEDAGRNLPHGVFVDNIGLNGLLIPEGQSEREFFITAAPIAAPGERWFHLRMTAAGRPTSLPVVIEVVEDAGGE